MAQALSREKSIALREMKDLRRCIENRAERQQVAFYMRGGLREFDHRFAALRDKYCEWFPQECSEEKMGHWVGRIIAVLEAFDYADATTRIEQAASAGTWNTQEE